MNDEPFSPIEEAAWTGFFYVQGILMRQLDADLQKDHRLSLAECQILLHLFLQPHYRSRLSDLSPVGLLTLSGMSRLIDRLERAGFVTKVGAGEDRRGAYAVLTDEGIRRFQAVRKAHHRDVQRRFLSLYNEQELQNMATYWQRFLTHKGDREE